jgi:coproporphyrinogen III oxidase
MDTTRLKDFFTGLQSRIVGELEAFDGQPFRTDSWQRPEGGGGISRLIEEGDFFERGGVNFSHVTGKSLPASATAAPATGRPRLGGDGRLAGAASAQPVLPDGAHERALLRRQQGRRGRCLVVRRRHGHDALLRSTRGCGHFHRTCKRCAGALRRRGLSEVQAVVRRLLLPQAPQRAARRRRRLLRRPQRRRLRALLRADAIRRQRLHPGLPAGPRQAPRHAVRRTRARLPGLPARALCRIQPGLGSRHAVRPAVGRAHRVDPDVAAAVVKWRYDWKPAAGSPEAELYEVFLQPADWA